MPSMSSAGFAEKECFRIRQMLSKDIQDFIPREESKGFVITWFQCHNPPGIGILNGGDSYLFGFETIQNPPETNHPRPKFIFWVQLITAKYLLVLHPDISSPSERGNAQKLK